MNDSKTLLTSSPSASTLLSGAGASPYLSPCISVIEIRVEQGFAGSPGGTIPGFDDSNGFGA